MASLLWTNSAKPNDPKLSDRRGWRGPCVAGERRRQEAGAVTAAPVRCSAWLGVAVLRIGFIPLGPLEIRGCRSWNICRCKWQDGPKDG